MREKWRSAHNVLFPLARGLGIALLASLPLLAGCATSSIFTPYPSQAAEVKADLRASHYDKALSRLNKFRFSQDKTLYMMERGRVAQIAGNYKQSIKAFEVAIAAENRADEKAKISLTDMASKGSSLLVNDNAIPYRAASYERILMHNYQALNYLALGNLEGAGVEVRRAALEQRVALEKHHKALAEAEDQAREQAVSVRRNQAAVTNKYRSMSAAVASLKNSFQSAYTFYVSGIIYELLGEPNDAYIDYQKAYEIFPENSFIQRDLLRLSRQLGFADDYERYTKMFPAELQNEEQAPAEVIFLYEEGFVPAKQEVRLDFFTPYGIQAIAFPIYSDFEHRQHPLTVSLKGKDLGASETISNIKALAIKDLEEKLPAMTVRQVLRLIAKLQMQKQAEENLGALGAAVTMIYSVVSESADRRSWLTLPNNVQILRANVPEGVSEIRLSAPGYQQAKVMTINASRNRPVILRVFAIDNRLDVTAL